MFPYVEMVSIHLILHFNKFCSYNITNMHRWSELGMLMYHTSSLQNKSSYNWLPFSPLTFPSWQVIRTTSKSGSSNERHWNQLIIIMKIHPYLDIIIKYLLSGALRQIPLTINRDQLFVVSTFNKMKHVLMMDDNVLWSQRIIIVKVTTTFNV